MPNELTKERKCELLDLVQKYNDQLREDAKGMTNEEKVYFLESHIETVGAAKDVFLYAVKNGHGKSKL